MGFEPPPADDTSYEADALLNKPPRLVSSVCIWQCFLMKYVSDKSRNVSSQDDQNTIIISWSWAGV